MTTNEVIQNPYYAKINDVIGVGGTGSFFNMLMGIEYSKHYNKMYCDGSV